MSQSEIRKVFGVHSVTPYSRTTHLPYGELKVLEGATFSLQGELVELKGGSFQYPWAVEDGAQSADLSFTPSQYEEFMFELFLGKAPTASSSGTGSVTTLTDVSGDLVSATTGVASVAVKTASDLKVGKYILKATDTNKVAVYGLYGGDLDRGTDKSFEDDNLKLTAADLTIPSSGASVEASGFGFEFVGGSGTVSLTSGDTAEFEVTPAMSRSYEVTIGGRTDKTPYWGALVAAEQGDDAFLIEIYKAKAVGMPINMEMKAFSKAEINAKCMYDAAKNGVCKIRCVEFA